MQRRRDTGLQVAATCSASGPSLLPSGVQMALRAPVPDSRKSFPEASNEDDARRGLEAAGRRRKTRGCSFILTLGTFRSQTPGQVGSGE